SICFVRSPIIDYQPDVPVDIVLALHACDTATDEVIAQTVRWDAPMLICIPCCHHDLNHQISSEVFRPVLRHGILKERLADILTDTFRALALRIMGYRTDVIEFISSEHTARNLMIRAIKSTEPGQASFIREYKELKSFWQVTPHIERLLGPSFTALLQE
ncbi:MAG: SAM-dependent methyltransferase, partial [uncultured Chloroflexia bacterium]